MPYTVDSTIEASTYNAFASRVNLVMGLGTGDSGYGVIARDLSTVSVGSTIRASDWVDWRDNINDINTHQGTDVVAEASAVVPPATDFEIGDPVIAYDGSDSRWNASANMDQSTSARLVVDVGTQVSIAGSVITNKRNTGWNTQVQHEFTATFTDVDEARHFFNTGGQIRIESALTGASNVKNDDWRDIIGRASTFVFDHTLYYAGDAAVTNVQRLQVLGSATGYTDNDLTIFEKRDAINGLRGSEGRIITFLVQFNDDVVGGGDPNVTGSLINSVGNRVSTGAVTATTPSYATTISMSAGS